MKRVLVVPRWGGGPNTDFYAWLERSLAVPITCLDPGPPEVAPWVGAVTRALGDHPEETVVLAHSVGCRAALMALAASGVRVHGLVLVAGWYAVDRPWPTLLPWTLPVDASGVRAGFVHVLLSDDDPFTADWRSTADRFVRDLRATVEVVPGAKHFNRSEEPDVLRVLRSRLA